MMMFREMPNGCYRIMKQTEHLEHLGSVEMKKRTFRALNQVLIYEF